MGNAPSIARSTKALSTTSAYYQAPKDFLVAEETRIATIANLAEAETHDEPPGLPRLLPHNILRRIPRLLADAAVHRIGNNIGRHAAMLDRPPTGLIPSGNRAVCVKCNRQCLLDVFVPIRRHCPQALLALCRNLHHRPLAWQIRVLRNQQVHKPSY